MQITNLTALEVGAEIRAGKRSVREAVLAALDAIGATDGQINAFITVQNREALLARADEVQAQINSGILASPLAGVPIGIKDNICTKGLRTTAASKMLANFVPPYSATVVERLEQAGMIVIGKLNLDEFAMGTTSESSFFGPVKNPWDLSRVPGGSSGGSAAAVAAGEVYATLGTDTGGSIRLPASYCGVVGFKPTYGAVSRYGAIACASSMDQVGPLTKDVADAAAMMDVLKGKDSRDALSLDLPDTSYLTALSGDIRGKRIALLNESFGASVDADVQARMRAAAETFRGLGAEVTEIDFPLFDYVMPTYAVLANAEASSNLARYDGMRYGHRAEGARNIEEVYRLSRGEGFGPGVVRRILLGTYVLSAGQYDSYYKKALQVKALIAQQLDAIFAEYDAILCPCASATAPQIGETLDPQKRFLADVFLAAANLAGLPALAFPAGFDAAGMPIGAQIIGRRLTDAEVLNFGFAFQSVTDCHKRTPGEGAGV
ncbi:MAG: Asp-tRNA(Asn)/Glu-tRNA(Gln) amidotransferase subunit GatA [Oscillospiraceae bacterium]|nr:Asp-tRNA(Asn)/Glu-tRNA(Gln) amidotransferase subunit GatA [Oscillospiraceae bacterium]